MKTPGLQRPFRSTPLSRRGLRSRHPGKGRRDVGATPFAHALSVVAAGPCSLPAGYPYESLSHWG
ncbi:hypothetical protein ECZU42_47620 [Escherichia coli]|nr:hypothetical protein ECZU42_47620 [Escherichia coli]